MTHEATDGSHARRDRCGLAVLISQAIEGSTRAASEA